METWEIFDVGKWYKWNGKLPCIPIPVIDNDAGQRYGWVANKPFKCIRRVGFGFEFDGIAGGLWCYSISIHNFVLCEGKEIITKVKNKHADREAITGTYGEIVIGDLLPFISSDKQHCTSISNVDYFRDLVNGKHADKFEFTTEFVITKEIPHESAVKPKCEK